ncbi:MAG: hypothetical protein RIS64_3959, partial [Bacteroidota bacterium]
QPVADGDGRSGCEAQYTRQLRECDGSLERVVCRWKISIGQAGLRGHSY